MNVKEYCSNCKCSMDMEVVEMHPASDDGFMEVTCKCVKCGSTIRKTINL